MCYLAKIIATLCCFFTISSASITAVSSITRCINDGSGEILRRNGTACGKKLVLAVTIQADEGKGQYFEANIRRVHDSTIRKNVQLSTPVRVTVIKSPVIINYRLYGVGYVNFHPKERIAPKKGWWCRADWFSTEDEAACGFQYDSSGEKIFDSQGFCCNCDTGNGDFERGDSENCNSRSGETVGHCLEMDELNAFVFGLRPPQLLFNITVTVDKVTYSHLNGSLEFERLDTLKLSPTRTTRSTSDSTIRAEYIADFHPNYYMPVLAHKYLLIPDYRNITRFPVQWHENAKRIGLLPSIFNTSEWLLIGKEHFAFSGLHCNKIGVSYSAFRNQFDGCSAVFSSCLQGQPFHFWKEDMGKKRAGRNGKYMAFNFGKVEFQPVSQETVTNFQLNFVAQRVQRSIVTLTMQADDLRVILNKSPGRIVEALISPFEALSSNGLLNVFIQNTGSLTATYNVFVGHCSAGIDWIPSEVVTLDPGEQTNLTFTVHAFNALGQINECQIELLDQSGDLLDNFTVYFETLDTCFCYGYCGCSCGENITDCPEPPDFADPDQFYTFYFPTIDININLPPFLEDFIGIFGFSFGGLFIFTWIILALIALGALKVILSIYKGDIDCPAVTNAAKFIWEGIVVCYRDCCSCLVKTSIDVAYGVGVAAKGRRDRTRYVGREDMVPEDSKRPVNCDGTCSGAKKARRIFRKKIRVMKRRGANTTRMFAWWEKPYTCTCIVKEKNNFCEVLKGLFFFIYCPILPFWWAVEFMFVWIQRKRRRRRRIAEFKKKKEQKQHKKHETFMMVDKYSREKEKKFIQFEKARQKKKQLQKDEANENKKMKNESENEEDKNEDIISDDESAKELGLDTDTTDTDEAGDIDELVDTKYPVYFNYAEATPESTPKSLKSPGTDFSIQGKLTQKDDTCYVFQLKKYDLQVNRESNGKVIKLKNPVQLEPSEFKKVIPANLVKMLITIKPLFNCVNDKPKQPTTEQPVRQPKVPKKKDQPVIEQPKKKDRPVTERVSKKKDQTVTEQPKKKVTDKPKPKKKPTDTLTKKPK